MGLSFDYCAAVGRGGGFLDEARNQFNTLNTLTHAVPNASTLRLLPELARGPPPIIIILALVSTEYSITW
jgi:hypothetical protein